jgi:hypothetical protein
VLGIFEIGFYKLFAWGWLQTVILLIFASCEARIIGVSHWHLAELGSLYPAPLLPPINQSLEMGCLWKLPYIFLGVASSFSLREFPDGSMSL